MHGLFSLLLVVVLAAPALAQPVATSSPKSGAGALSATYAEARKARAKNARQSKAIIGQSTEGASATAYTDSSGHVKSIDVTYFGETGRAKYEFYFVGFDPFLVREQQLTYNAPITMTAEAAKIRLKEEGIRYPTFDDRKTNRIERFYRFDGSRLLELVGPRVAMGSKPWNDAEQATRIREVAKEVLAEFASK